MLFPSGRCVADRMFRAVNRAQGQCPASNSPSVVRQANSQRYSPSPGWPSSTIGWAKYPTTGKAAQVLMKSDSQLVVSPTLSTIQALLASGEAIPASDQP